MIFATLALSLFSLLVGSTSIPNPFSGGSGSNIIVTSGASAAANSGISNYPVFYLLDKDLPEWKRLYRTVSKTKDVIGYIINRQSVFLSMVSVNCAQHLKIPLFCRGIVLKEGTVHIMCRDFAAVLLKDLDVLQLDYYCQKYNCEESARAALEEYRSLTMLVPKDVYSVCGYSIFVAVKKYLPKQIDEALKYSEFDNQMKYTLECMERFLHNLPIDKDFTNSIYEALKNSGTQAWPELHLSALSALSSLVDPSEARQAVLRNFLSLAKVILEEQVPSEFKAKIEVRLREAVLEMRKKIMKHEPSFMPGCSGQPSDAPSPLCAVNAILSSPSAPPIDILHKDILEKILFLYINLDSCFMLVSYSLVCKQWQSVIQSSSSCFNPQTEVIQNKHVPFIKSYKAIFSSCTVDDFISFMGMLTKVRRVIIPRNFNICEKWELLKRTPPAQSRVVIDSELLQTICEVVCEYGMSVDAPAAEKCLNSLEFCSKHILILILSHDKFATTGGQKLLATLFQKFPSFACKKDEDIFDFMVRTACLANLPPAQNRRVLEVISTACQLSSKGTACVNLDCSVFLPLLLKMDLDEHLFEKTCQAAFSIEDIEFTIRLSVHLFQHYRNQ